MECLRVSTSHFMRGVVLMNKNTFLVFLVCLVMVASPLAVAKTAEDVAIDWFTWMLFSEKDELEKISTEKYWASAEVLIPMLLMGMAEARKEFAPEGVGREELIEKLELYGHIKTTELGEGVKLVVLADEEETIMSFIVLEEDGVYKVGLLLFEEAFHPIFFF